MTDISTNGEQLRALVRERYTQSIQQVSTAQSGCCGQNCCTSTTGDPITSNLYSGTDLGGLPIAAVLASRGCGNPTALAELHVGEKVLDLGCGGGIDVLLSARRVGSTGFAYGLDMTDAMLDLAERNRTEAQIENVQFLKGEIE
ncbi:MAG TPA: methyltransferase domain-containing protein, partial [Ktedonobacteraceae bacterium]|nr:methyltransferase domain-containing protein [Ktedonobacteraceae bacterium]